MIKKDKNKMKELNNKKQFFEFMEQLGKPENKIDKRNIYNQN